MSSFPAGGWGGIRQGVHYTDTLRNNTHSNGQESLTQKLGGLEHVSQQQPLGPQSQLVSFVCAGLYAVFEKCRCLLPFTRDSAVEKVQAPRSCLLCPRS